MRKRHEPRATLQVILLSSEVIQRLNLNELLIGVGSKTRKEDEEAVGLGPGRIYPLDTFTLDIFVFNKSERTRRFEISCLERRRRRGGEDSSANDGPATGGGGGAAALKMGYRGIMPMAGRVRIG